MRRHLRNPWIWVVAALVFALWLLWPRPLMSPAPVPPVTPVPTAPAAPAAPPSAEAPAGFLPAEARQTLALIARGGPFPHAQDGQVFGNREGLLPARPRGYYREYTVATPGADDRGGRRIVTGGNPPRVWYYTDDHYASFRAFQWPEEPPR